MNRRLIGYRLPLKLLSDENVKENKIRVNKLSSIHQWFAGRPITSSRATAYAALIEPPSNKKDLKRVNKTLDDLSIYVNKDNWNVLESARQDILKSNDDKSPKVLDPFGGRGAIPLECIRLGCETYSNDYNPVAYIIQKCALEYPLKYGSVKRGTKPEYSNLIKDIEKWSTWIKTEAHKEIGTYFPKTKTGAPSVYLWARTITCKNPRCEATIPLINSYELNRKSNISLYPVIKGKSITFDIVGGKYGNVSSQFDAKTGTIDRGYTTCPFCQNTIKPKDTNKLLMLNPDEDQMIAVVERPPKGQRTFRKVTAQDVDVYHSCKAKLDEMRSAFIAKYDIDPVPTEHIETPHGEEYGHGKTHWHSNSMVATGQTRWEHLYNIRHKLILVALLHKIRHAYRIILSETNDAEYAKCISCYLGIILNRLVESKSSKSCVWLSDVNTTHHGLSNPVFKRIVYYAEVNPFDNAGLSMVTKTVCGGVIQSIKTYGKPAKKITCSSATKLDYPDEYFDAVFTDPPYYDFVAYANFSDFYYVWLKRSIGDLFPSVFKTNLSPKRQELVSDEDKIVGITSSNLSKEDLTTKSKKYYEDNMAIAISEIYRVLKPAGILTLVYTHSTLDGWETLIKAIRKSGFIITAAWPLSTETQSRKTAQGTASVQSSIYMVGSKWKREEVGFYTGVKKDMFANLKVKLKEFSDTLNRTDYFIAAIGFALEWFTKYEKVVEDSGKEVTICRMLNDIRQFTINHKMEELIGSNVTESGLAGLYVMYRWLYGNASAPYDEARKIFQGCGINIEDHYGGIVQKQGSTIKVLDAFERGDADSIPEDDLINVLHRALLYREVDKTAECNSMLAKHGYSKSTAFYGIAAAIVRVQDSETKETRRLKALLESTDVGVQTLDAHM